MNPKPIEILSTGVKSSFNAGPLEITPQILHDLADTFSGSVPFVAGHPPADREQEFELAQASSVAVQGDKLLVTGYRGFPPPVRAIVNSGELNRVSCKLRAPDHPENKSQRWKLLHIGLFGRNPTADQGIADVMLSAGDADVLLSAEATLPEVPPTDDGDSPVPPATTPTPPTEESPVPPATTPTPPTEEAATLAAQRAALEAERREFELRRAVFDRARSIEPWLDQQVAAGKVLPGEKPMLSAVLSQVPPQDIELRAADGTQQQVSLSQALKAFIENLPVRVRYDEVAPADPELQAASTEDPKTHLRALMAARYAAARRSGK